MDPKFSMYKERRFSWVPNALIAISFLIALAAILSQPRNQTAIFRWGNECYAKTTIKVICEVKEDGKVFSGESLPCEFIVDPVQ